MTSPTKSPFLIALEKELSASRWNAFTDNYDTLALGDEPKWTYIPAWKQCVNSCISIIKQTILYYKNPDKYYEPIAAEYTDIHFLHNLLVDEASKNLVVKICAFRALGHRKVKLPRHTPSLASHLKQIDELRTEEPPIKIDFMDSSLSQYDCRPLGYNFKAYGTLSGLVCTLIQKQYEFSESVYGYKCGVEPGDVVVEAGGCWGETTLYFADKAGSNGSVIAFEFIPSNIDVFNQNKIANPLLSDRITLISQPLWNSSGQKMYYVDWGPGSRVTLDETQYKYDGECETTTIDETVARLGLKRVDFIKMDIEGAELQALKGAEKTIRTYRPKLAISIYHHIKDFKDIPLWLYSLNLTYDFFLDHHTIYENETVLFAIPRDRYRE